MNINGIINVKKEKGYTSFDVVACLRKILQMKKIGHTGTLDPDATGVLPVCLGKGTKVVDLLTNKKKTYKAIFQTGFITDTQDISGEVIERFEGTTTLEEVKDKLMGFLGDIEQIPPMYSAVRHNGVKLYKLAREGITVEREARKATILSIKDIHQLNEDTFSFEVTCSKGTYIRTLIYDLGEQLQIGATMTELERTNVEPFSIDTALTLDQIRELVANEQFESVVTQIDSMFQSYPAILVSTNYDITLYNGNKLPTRLIEDMGRTLVIDEKYRVYDSKNQFIGIYKVALKDGINILKVEKMFF